MAIDEAGARYDATDSELGTDASVRVLHRIRPDDASLRRLLELLTEVSNLAIPGIKPLRAVGRTRTQDVYYATDQVVGQSLAQRLDRGAMRPLDAVNSLAQAGETLSRAHMNGVVHGALHPGAVILPTGKQDDDAVQLLDFGLGPLVMAADVLPMGTRSAATPYQSPEQAKGDPFDQRADIYAFGALLFEALTGRPPFAGRSALEVLAHQLRGEAPSLAEVEPLFEGSPLQNLIDQSMQINPDDRFSTIDAMVTALRNAGRAEATRKKPAVTGKSKPSKTSDSAPAKKKEAAKKASKAAQKPPSARRSPRKSSSTAEKGSPWLTVVGGLIILSAIVGVVLWMTGAFDNSLPEDQLPNPAVDTTAEAPTPAKTPSRDVSEEQPRRRPRPSRPAPSSSASSESSSEPPLAAPSPPLPDRAVKLVQEGQDALREKQYSRAISRFRRAKRIAPEHAQIARGLGMALMYAGQTNAAASELERYLELDPNASDRRFIQSSIRTLRE